MICRRDEILDPDKKWLSTMKLLTWIGKLSSTKQRFEADQSNAKEVITLLASFEDLALDAVENLLSTDPIRKDYERLIGLTRIMIEELKADYPDQFFT